MSGLVSRNVCDRTPAIAAISHLRNSRRWILIEKFQAMMTASDVHGGAAATTAELLPTYLFRLQMSWILRRRSALQRLKRQHRLSR